MGDLALHLRENNIPLLRYKLFEPYKNKIKHATLLRSPLLEQSRSVALETLGFLSPVFPHLVHGAQVENVTKSSGPSLTCDGIITAEKGLSLAITHADCQVALMYDPRLHVIGNIHCGWRGNVQNIYQKSVEKLHKDFGCDPSTLCVALAPSLGKEHAEFIHFEKEWPKEFFAFQYRPTYFDLWEIARAQLIEAGVRAKNIGMPPFCTYKQEELCYSYRRDHTSARHVTIIELI